MSETAPTFNQVNEQYLQQVKDPNVSPTVLVKRTDGSISTGQLKEVDVNHSSGNYVDLGVNEQGEPIHKMVAGEALSDEVQQKLAVELADKALLGAEVEVETSEPAKASNRLEPIVIENPSALTLVNAIGSPYVRVGGSKFVPKESLPPEHQ